MLFGHKTDYGTFCAMLFIIFEGLTIFKSLSVRVFTGYVAKLIGTRVATQDTWTSLSTTGVRKKWVVPSKIQAGRVPKVSDEMSSKKNGFATSNC